MKSDDKNAAFSQVQFLKWQASWRGEMECHIWHFHASFFLVLRASNCVTAESFAKGSCEIDGSILPSPKDRVGEREERAFWAASPQRLWKRSIGMKFCTDLNKGHFVTQVACCKGTGSHAGVRGLLSPQWHCAVRAYCRTCWYLLSHCTLTSESHPQAVGSWLLRRRCSWEERGCSVTLTGSQPPSRASEEDAAEGWRDRVKNRLEGRVVHVWVRVWRSTGQWATGAPWPSEGMVHMPFLPPSFLHAYMYVLSEYIYIYLCVYIS